MWISRLPMRIALEASSRVLMEKLAVSYHLGHMAVALILRYCLSYVSQVIS